MGIRAVKDKSKSFLGLCKQSIKSTGGYKVKTLEIQDQRKLLQRYMILEKTKTSV